MFLHRCICRRPLLALGVFLTLALGLMFLDGPAGAQYYTGTASVIRVEEDWSLMVSQPDPTSAAPQVSTQMARNWTTSRFGNLHLNSTDIPAFALGGLQLETWKGSTNLGYQNSSTSPVMSTNNELITWTQYLAQNSSGGLTFGISAASSQTFGDFSGLSLPISGSSSNLSDYDPTYSQYNSGVTFGANRVTSLTIVQVRMYGSDGSVMTDSTPRVVCTSSALGGGN
jgi:hypothetical protein